MEKEENNKEEFIILSDLKEIDQNRIQEYPKMIQRKRDDDFQGSEEEKKKLQEEEEKKKIEKKKQLKNKSLNSHYSIDNQKNKELESVFGQIKLKIKLSGKLKILSEGKIIALSKGGFTIFDTTLFKKQTEIKFEKQVQSHLAIELDNGDLIIACSNDDKMYNYELLVYRLKDQQYFLIQKIKDGGLGLPAKYYITGHCSYSRQYHKKDYKINELKKISGNRFLCLSNMGLKMYSLNEKNEYSLVLLNEQLDDLLMIREIEENKLIFMDQQVTTNYFYSTKEMFLGFIELKNATKEDLDKKLNIVKEKGYQNAKKQGYCHNRDMFGFPIFRGPEVEEKEEVINYDDELKNIIESLKFSCSTKATIKYNISGIRLSDTITLKNKYLILVIGINIIFLDLKEGKEQKIFVLFIDGIFEGNDSLFMVERMEIKKWNNAEDNQFLILIGKNVFLFEMIEDEKNGIRLKILSQAYFPNIANAKSLKNIGEKNNKFCCLDEERRGLFYDEDEDKDSSNCISFY